jgi:hypothetical protein
LMLKALDRSQQDEAQDTGPHIVQPKLVVRASSAPPCAGRKRCLEAGDAI